jgi:outer membrane protein insertion porin family
LSNFFLVFVIFAIPIKKVEFTGNTSVPSRVLYDAIISKTRETFDDINLTFDANRIGRVYHNHGFFNTKVMTGTQIDSNGIDITFAIQEGTRPRIRRIVFEGDTYKAYKRFLKIKPRDFFIQLKIKDSETGIRDYLLDKGYALAKVSTSVLADSGALVFSVNKGSIYYIKDITIRGLKVCNPDVVRREITLKKGDPYSKSRIRTSQRRIYSLSFFGTVDVEMLTVPPDSIELVFNIRELKSRILNFGFGVTIPPSFLFSFGIEELNLFNIGHRFLIRPSFRIKTERAWEAKLEGRYTVPYITPARLTLTLLPFYWREDTKAYVRKTTGGEIRLSKIYTDHIQVTIANKYKYVDYLARTAPDTAKGITNSVKLELMTDYRDEFFNPKRGLYCTPFVEYAGGVLGGRNDYIRPELEVRLFKSVYFTTIAQRLRIGMMVSTGNLATDEKYSIGGQYSLRGYDEKSVGPDSLAIDSTHYGSVIINYNLEYRVHLPFYTGIIGFLDMGYVDNTFSLRNSEYLKFSAGFGLRYYSPIGPVRADMGFPLSTANGGERRPQIYVGIYHIF